MKKKGKEWYESVQGTEEENCTNNDKERIVKKGKTVQLYIELRNGWKKQSGDWKKGGKVKKGSSPTEKPGYSGFPQSTEVESLLVGIRGGEVVVPDKVPFLLPSKGYSYRVHHRL